MGEGLNKQSIIVLFILIVITLGLYVPYWFYKKADVFNFLNSKTKISKSSIYLLFVLGIAQIVLTILIFLSLDSLSFVANLAQLQYLVQGVYTILLLIISLGVRKILSDHTGQPVSLIFTFLFALFYLQYKINALIDMSQKEYNY